MHSHYNSFKSAEEQKSCYTKQMKIKEQKIALIGRNGSGKSRIAVYLQEKGFQWISLSNVLRDYAKRKGWSLDRESLMQLGALIKADKGPSVLAQEALSQSLETKDQQKWVFDSIRLPAELDCLKANGFYLLGIDADINIRFNRIAKRGHITDQVDFQTFKQQDEAEFFGKTSGQHIEACFERCDIILNNDGDFETMKKELDKIC